MYRYETRKLLRVICQESNLETVDDMTPEWEKSAYAALVAWLEKKGKTKELDDYRSKAEWTVVEKFADLLKPFTSPEGLCKTSLHENAKQVLMDDKHGLTLSLMLAHDNLRRDGKSWAWQVLDFDGYMVHQAGGMRIITVTEIKSGQGGLSNARKQLTLRARFLDAVATYTSCPRIQCVRLVVAILKGSDEDSRMTDIEEWSTADYDRVEKILYEVNYFRL